MVEVSFEVANKVGGIYQVLSSKSSKMIDFYGDGYLTVGYFDEESMRKEFAPRENPYSEAFQKLREEGIECYYGVWEVEGSPRTVLVDASGLEKDVNEIKQSYWEKHGIDSINAGPDFDEPVKWGYAVSRLIQELEKDQDFVVHLHEWLSSSPIFNVDSPTVFTTHATVLGRALSNSDYDLISMVEDGDIDSEGLAEELGVKEKHDMEQAAAREADVFTTVSDVTGQEASAIHGIEPDKILPNGFNVEDYPSLEDLSVNHKQKKDKVKEFLNAYFDPYYPVNLENDPRVFFTSGRYEFHNKGFDILIEALGKINERPGDDLYFFFLVPSDVKGPDMEVLENKSLYEELEDYIESKIPELRKKFVNSVASGESPVKELEKELNDSEQLEFLQQNFYRKDSEGPPLSAFELNYENDEIVNALKKEGITNSEDDRVKAVFYPTYLSVGDKLLSMEYEDMVVASSAGFFPSYYEPWGYTPVETAANGALSLTTDLAGFGQFLMNQVESSERKGIEILERRHRERSEVVEDLARIIEEFLSFDKTEITERKHNARKLAQLTSWEKLGENYRDAHRMAVKNS